MWIKTVMLSEKSASPHLVNASHYKTFNNLIKGVARMYQMPTITECVFRREKKIILRQGEDELYIEVFLALPEGEKETAPIHPSLESKV